jgi:hypothetical protein
MLDPKTWLVQEHISATRWWWSYLHSPHCVRHETHDPLLHVVMLITPTCESPPLWNYSSTNQLVACIWCHNLRFPSAFTATVQTSSWLFPLWVGKGSFWTCGFSLYCCDLITHNDHSPKSFKKNSHAVETGCCRAMSVPSQISRQALWGSLLSLFIG